MRYLVAEEYKEDGNAAFKRGNYEEAIELYTLAHKSEPRLPIYLLNRSMAELKLYRWDEAEMDCTAVLRKHRTNAKALWRRAKARRATAQLTGDVEKLIAAERGTFTKLQCCRRPTVLTRVSLPRRPPRLPFAAAYVGRGADRASVGASRAVPVLRVLRAVYLRHLLTRHIVYALLLDVVHRSAPIVLQQEVPTSSFTRIGLLAHHVAAGHAACTVRRRARRPT